MMKMSFYQPATVIRITDCALSI